MFSHACEERPKFDLVYYAGKLENPVVERIDTASSISGPLPLCADQVLVYVSMTHNNLPDRDPQLSHRVPVRLTISIKAPPGCDLKFSISAGNRSAGIAICHPVCQFARFLTSLGSLSSAFSQLLFTSLITFCSPIHMCIIHIAPSTK